MTARLTVPLLLLLMLPAPAMAGTVEYSGHGTDDEKLDVSFTLVDKEKVKNLAFDNARVRCDDGTKGRIGKRTFRFSVPLDENNEFKASGSGSSEGVEEETARASGKVRVGRGKAAGVVKIKIEEEDGDMCETREEPWKAKR